MLRLRTDISGGLGCGLVSDDNSVVVNSNVYFCSHCLLWSCNKSFPCAVPSVLHFAVEDRDTCFTLSTFLMSYDCLFIAYFPHCSMSWSTARACDISWIIL